METSLKKRKDAPQTPATQEKQDAQRPVKTVRIEDVSCSIWSREHLVKGEKATFWSATFERSYKDADGQWRYTKSFDAGDLGKVIAVAKQAADFIEELRKQYEAA